MKNLFYDENYNVSDFTFVLSNRKYDHLGEIINIDYSSINYNAPMQGAKEISFTVYKELNGHTEKLWDQIKDLKIIWVKELDEYFQINVPIKDNASYIQKVVTGTSVCEAELSQTMIESLEINTKEDIEREDYDPEHPTVFYNPNPNISLLHKVLYKNPNYTIKHVDETLWNIVRQFSISEKYVYDFLVNELAEEVNCMFQFDSTDRTISVYDVDEDRLKKYGLPEYGDDTTVYIDKENLSDEINFETDVDSIKNCFRIKGGDDVITSAIRAINPSGGDTIYYFSQEQKDDMPQELVDKIEAYDKLLDLKTPDYQKLTKSLYDTIDSILYYQSEMMPEIPKVDVTAATEAAKLTVANLNPIAVSKYESASIPSSSTVNSAVLNYAKAIVKTGYVKVTINNGTYTYGTTNGTWVGNFKVENYSNKEDIVISPTITLTITGDSDEYIKQRMNKIISENDDEDHSVSSMLTKSKEDFAKEINKYCYNRVKSFGDAIQSGIDILLETPWASENDNSSSPYQTIYLPMYEKYQLCEARMKELEVTIGGLEDKQKGLLDSIAQIQNDLNFEKFLGKDMYALFCSYRREQVYSNDNFISDGLDNAQVMEKAQELFEIAKKELVKSGEYQHKMSASLYNLMKLPEFKNTLDKLDLGNWIRVGVDGVVYKLRLIRYSINCGSQDNIEIEFSDSIKNGDGTISDLQSLLSSVSSMSSTYDYVSRQSKAGDKANIAINKAYVEGLNSSLTRIKNNNNEEITYGQFGIMAKEYDDIDDTYSDEQLRITHNAIVMTEDNWKSASLAIGKHDYTCYDHSNDRFETRTGYGVSSKFLNSPYIYGGQIIGSEIISDNYKNTDTEKAGSYMNLKDGKFWIAGGHLTYDGNELKFFNGDNKDINSLISQNSSAISAEVTRAEQAETDLDENKVSQTGNNVDQSFSWELLSDHFSLKSNGNEVFRCDNGGITVNGYAEAEAFKALKADFDSLDAIAITTQNLSAQTISADKVIFSDDTNLTAEINWIKGADGLQAKVDSSGGKNESFAWTLTTKGFALVANGVDVFDCNKDGLVINGDVLVKNINNNVSKISGDTIITGSIKADRLEADSITANEINFGSIFNTENMLSTAITSLSTGLQAKVSQVDGNESFSWNLTSNAFKLFTSNKDNPVFICDANGVKVDGYVDAETFNAIAITTNNLSAQSINADQIKAGRISVDHLDAKTITTENFATNFSAQEINADKITSGKISADRIDADQIISKTTGTQDLSAKRVYISDGILTMKYGDITGWLGFKPIWTGETTQQGNRIYILQAEGEAK